MRVAVTHILADAWQGASFSVFSVLMGVSHLPLKSRLCGKFQDAASGRVLYKSLLASMGVHSPPAAPPARSPRGRLAQEHLRQEEQQANGAAR